MSNDGKGKGWFRAPNCVFDLPEEIDAPARLILLCLLRYADSDGVCWPHQDKIVENTRLSRHTVMRKLELLEEQGILTRHRERRGKGYRYRICLNKESHVAQSDMTGSTE